MEIYNSRNRFKLMCLLTILLVLSVGLNIYQFFRDESGVINAGEVSWIEKFDSLSPDTIKKTKVVSVPYIVCIGNKHKADTLSNDTVYLTQSSDSTIDIQLTQKVYRDSDYVAYVSGFMPNLDSLMIRKTHSYVVPQALTTKKKMYSLGVMAGYGYGFNYRGFEPFIGLGLTYSIFKW